MRRLMAAAALLAAPMAASAQTPMQQTPMKLAHHVRTINSAPSLHGGDERRIFDTFSAAKDAG